MIAAAIREEVPMTTQQNKVAVARIRDELAAEHDAIRGLVHAREEAPEPIDAIAEAQACCG